MRKTLRATFPAVALAAWVALSCASCRRNDPGDGADAQVTTLGSVEVTARLLEIPEGAIIRKDLYDYATVLKYQVLKVHRGTVKGDVIYIGHYNPFKPRSEAADRRAQGIGGNLRTFQAGQVHRMAMDAPLDDCVMVAVINKYFDERPDPIYWAVWTNLAGEQQRR
jgi:hypothetical protein